MSVSDFPLYLTMSLTALVDSVDIWELKTKNILQLWRLTISLDLGETKKVQMLNRPHVLYKLYIVYVVLAVGKVQLLHLP